MKELERVDIQRRIYWVREHRVMLSTDLARLYQVQPKVLIQAVKRNRDRFPDDFMFQLSPDEFENLKSHIVTSSWGGLRRANPYAFTEQGVAMLSSVLRSSRAIQVNIAIMRAFVRIRQLKATHEDLAMKIEELERALKRHDRRFDKHTVRIQAIFEAIQALVQSSEPRVQNVLNPPGFKRNV